MDQRRVLVHLASGIGNIVLATPLLVTLSRRFEAIDLLLHADYPGVCELFQGWSRLGNVFDGRVGDRPSGPYDIMVPAIPPFAWSRFAPYYRTRENVVRRPDDALFYRDEQNYYLAFARQLGCRTDLRPDCFLPVAPSAAPEITEETVVIAPGCKTGVMAKKRWPHFPELAELLADVVLVGTQDDVRDPDGTPTRYPPHARFCIDRLSLRELAGLLAASRVVVANDSGIGHIAAALGVRTILIFGPTPDAALGRLPANAMVLRSGLACEPCWFSSRLVACGGRIRCLNELSAARVAAVIRNDGIR